MATLKGQNRFEKPETCMSNIIVAANVDRNVLNNSLDAIHLINSFSSVWDRPHCPMVCRANGTNIKYGPAHPLNSFPEY